MTGSYETWSHRQRTMGRYRRGHVSSRPFDSRGHAVARLL